MNHKKFDPRITIGSKVKISDGVSTYIGVVYFVQPNSRLSLKNGKY